MTRLRDRLRQSDPALAKALDRAWEIAREEWLPALGLHKGSFNSYPHLRNVEHHLDAIVHEYSHLIEDGSPTALTPLELYLLLAGVLFHDIGRIKNEPKEKSHGEKSEAIINNEYAALGIPSPELARCLGRICKAHGFEGTEGFGSDLKDGVVGSHGRVRLLLLSGLLFLADHMDSAFDRALPLYIGSSKEIDVVGAFRRVIAGVMIDSKAQMVVTQLTDFELEKGKDSTTECSIVYKNTEKIKESESEKVKALWEKLKNELNGIPMNKARERVKDVEETDLCTDFDEVGDDASVGYWPRKSLRKSVLKKDFDKFGMLDWLVARRICIVEKDEDNLEFDWPPNVILSVVMGDVFSNVEALRVVRKDLASAGIPIRAWLLEYNEHLYDDRGRETFEPVFTEDYLCRVTKSMWALSTEIFGSSLFTYKTLADHVREPDVERVRRAVRRIAIVTACPPEKKSPPEPIWAGTTHWRWQVAPQEEKSENRDCRFFSAAQVCKAIGNLVTPYS